MLQVHFKYSKCEQFSYRVDVYVGRTDDKLCPVAAVLAYFAIWGSTPGPLFNDRQCCALTKARFVARIWDVLETAGYPAAQFAGHSFRIGSATAAALAGLEDSRIQALGWWSSATFLVYIRMPRVELAAVTAQIATLDEKGCHERRPRRRE